MDSSCIPTIRSHNKTVMSTSSQPSQPNKSALKRDLKAAEKSLKNAEKVLEEAQQDNAEQAALVVQTKTELRDLEMEVAVTTGKVEEERKGQQATQGNLNEAQTKLAVEKARVTALRDLSKG